MSSIDNQVSKLIDTYKLKGLYKNGDSKGLYVYVKINGKYEMIKEYKWYGII